MDKTNDTEIKIELTIRNKDYSTDRVIELAFDISLSDAIPAVAALFDAALKSKLNAIFNAKALGINPDKILPPDPGTR